MVFEDGFSTLKKFIDESSSIVFFGGAGVSTESGIPDFRSTDGLYNQSYDYPPETILSRSFFRQNPEEFFRFYREKMLFLDAKPNNAQKPLHEVWKVLYRRGYPSFKGDSQMHLWWNHQAGCGAV